MRGLIQACTKFLSSVDKNPSRLLPVVKLFNGPPFSFRDAVVDILKRNTQLHHLIFAEKLFLNLDVARANELYVVLALPGFSIVTRVHIIDFSQIGFCVKKIQFTRRVLSWPPNMTNPIYKMCRSTM